MNDLLIIDMLPTYGLLFYLLISVFVFVGCRGLRRRTSDRGLLRFAVGAFLVVSALGAVFAALVYIMAAPLAQPDMVDFYRMYRPELDLPAGIVHHTICLRRRCRVSGK